MYELEKIVDFIFTKRCYYHWLHFPNIPPIFGSITFFVEDYSSNLIQIHKIDLKSQNSRSNLHTVETSSPIQFFVFFVENWINVVYVFMSTNRPVDIHVNARFCLETASENYNFSPYVGRPRDNFFFLKLVPKASWENGNDLHDDKWNKNRI